MNDIRRLKCGICGKRFKVFNATEAMLLHYTCPLCTAVERKRKQEEDAQRRYEARLNIIIENAYWRRD